MRVQNPTKAAASEMSDVTARPIDDQVARSTPLTPNQ
jgi:hypothetical protein